MARITYTTDELVERLRGLYTLGDTGTVGALDEDIVAAADEEQKELYAKVLTLREHYFLRRQRVAIPTGLARVALPTRAFFQKLHEVYYVSNGDRQKIDQLGDEELQDYNDSGASVPSGFALEGDDLLLIPDRSPGFTGEIEYVFPFRPSTLVLPDEVRQVLSVNLVAKTVTLATAPPATWATPGSFDVHGKESGAHVRIWDAEASIAGAVLTFTLGIDGSVFGTKPIQAGDWVCLAGEAIIPSLPQDIIPQLIRAVAVRYAESDGDVQMLPIHEAKLQKQQDANQLAMESRIERKPMRIRGRRGFL